jgi:hypothetical protein
MDLALRTSIHEWRRIRFRYHDEERVVEPQCYGLGKRGTVLLRAYQPKGGSALEPTFDVAKIEGLEVLDEHFDAPGPNYHMNDSAMIEIHAQLDPTRPRGARRTRGT